MIGIIIFLILVGCYCFSTFDNDESENINVLGLILTILSFSVAFIILDSI